MFVVVVVVLSFCRQGFSAHLWLSWNSVDQAGLEIRDLSASASRVLPVWISEYQGCAVFPVVKGHQIFLWNWSDRGLLATVWALGTN